MFCFACDIRRRHPPPTIQGGRPHSPGPPFRPPEKAAGQDAKRLAQSPSSPLVEIAAGALPLRPTRCSKNQWRWSSESLAGAPVPVLTSWLRCLAPHKAPVGPAEYLPALPKVEEKGVKKAPQKVPPPVVSKKGSPTTLHRKSVKRPVTPTKSQRRSKS